MFEEKTYEAIMTEVLAAAPHGIDTREGSIFYDAVAGCVLKIAKLYTDLDLVFGLVFLTTATGSYLDLIGSEHGVERNAATKSLYNAAFVGATPVAGTRFFGRGTGYYFSLVQNSGTLYLQAEVAGAETASIAAGTVAVPVNEVAGLTSATFGSVAEAGADIESDEDYRTRILDAIAGPAENANKQQYKTWCESVDGVGRARILALWNGVNTVKAVLYGTDGLPASSTVVSRVQTYIDPGSTGLGEGVAPIGAYFTAAAATQVTINVSFSVTLASGKSLQDVVDEATDALEEQFAGLTLDSPEGENMVVRLSSIGSLIYSLASVVDYAALTLNSGTANIEIDEDEAAVLGEVTVVESV